MPPSGCSRESSATPITKGSTSSSRSRSWRIDARDAMAMTAQAGRQRAVHAPCIAGQQHDQQDAGQRSAELEARRQSMEHARAVLVGLKQALAQHEVPRRPGSRVAGAAARRSKGPRHEPGDRKATTAPVSPASTVAMPGGAPATSSE